MNAMANRVLDPWAKEEKGVGNSSRATTPFTSVAGKSKGASKSTARSTFRADGINGEESRKNTEIDYYDANQTQLPQQRQRAQRILNQQDVMLNKVRLNQERLQSKKRGEKEDTRTERRQSKDYLYEDESEVPIIDVSRRDYYDEDDEGYEDREVQLTRKKRKWVDSSGSSNVEDWQNNKKNPSSSTPLMAGGGIFFSNSRAISNKNQQQQQQRQNIQPLLAPANDIVRANNAKKIAENVEEEAKDAKRVKRKEPIYVPLLDEDENEMFLTLEQADKIVKNILSSTTSSENDIIVNEESSMDQNEEGDDDNINQWEDVGITDPNLLSNLRSNSKLCCPTPLAAQDRACPPIVAGNDVLISTHTGSGKTLAFLAPIAQSLLINCGGGGGGGGVFPKAIVVAPGRELASQIVSVAQTLFADTGLKVSLAIGGTPYSRNVEKLRKTKPDVVVGVSCIMWNYNRFIHCHFVSSLSFSI